MRVVLDTDVMVAAIRSDSGASRRLVRACLQQRCTLLVSVPLCIEYEAVMTRPKHLVVAGLDVSDIHTLLDAVVKASEPVQLAFLWRPALRDPDDDMVLETALNGRADRLVTFNLHDFAAAGSKFGIEVCRPGEVLEILESRS